MEDFLPHTSSPLSQDQIVNHNSSSSSFNYDFSFDDDQNYHFDFNDSFCNNHNPNHNPNPPCYQDSGPSNTYFSMGVQTPVLLETTTTANTSESSCMSVDATYMPQPNNFERHALVRYVCFILKSNLPS